MPVARIYSLLVLLLFYVGAHAQNPVVIGNGTENFSSYKIYGKVLSDHDNQALPGVNIYIKRLKKGVSTDDEGNFILNLKKGSYTFEVSFIGYESLSMPVVVQGDGKLMIRLKEDLMKLKEIIVSSEDPRQNVKSVDLGKNVLSANVFREIPPFLGEVDILKTLTLLPGVSTVGEASSGFHVRGGGSDQNLILLGGATLYNPTHLFGFFTAFNSDFINKVTLYKGGIPARYGGRGSSIIDLTYKSGNFNEWEGQVTVGTISSKATIEGPLIQNKLSIALGGRASYANWLLKLANDADIKNSSAQFFDGNAIVTYQMTPSSRLQYSFYYSGDDFSFGSDTSFVWNNRNHVLSWNQSFGKKISLDFSLVSSHYNFDINNDSGIDDFQLRSAIQDNGINLNLDYIISDNNTLNAGVQSKLYEINPGNLSPSNDNSSVLPKMIENEKGSESAAYIQHKLDLGTRFAITYGLRYNLFRYLGEKTVSEYEALLPRREENITGEKVYGQNEVVTQYDGFAPRFSFRWSLNSVNSIKLGYNKMYQFIHVISNTSTIAPTDIWKLSDSFISPQIVTQYSLGYFRNFSNNTFEASLEGYFKDIENIVEYKDGADLILNDHIETELLTGEGQAYGVELFVKKKRGSLTGWLGYTYSRSIRRVIGPYEEEQVNNGEWYPSNFDKPHDLTVVTNYEIRKRLAFSAIFTYSTGRPATYPSAKFDYAGTKVAYFDNRNQQRVPDYHRLDLSLSFGFDAKQKLLSGDWVFSIYNVYGRKNAFSVFFDDIPGAPPQAFKLSVLGTPFPSLSYNVKF